GGVQGLHGEPRLRCHLGGCGGHDKVHGGFGCESRRGAQSRRARQIKVRDALTGAALVVLAGIILWHIQGFPAMPGQKFGPAWFPGLIAAGLGACGVLLIATGMRETAPWIATPGWLRSPRARVGIAALLGGLVFYLVAADALGFHITGLVLLVVWMRLLGASWRVTMPV